MYEALVRHKDIGVSSRKHFIDSRQCTKRGQDKQIELFPHVALDLIKRNRLARNTSPLQRVDIAQYQLQCLKLTTNYI
jgi:hypothetical protein